MELVHVSVDNHIATVVMDNPKNLNAIDIPMANAISKALSDCEQNDDVKVVVLTGAGRAFSGGGDIGYFIDEVKKPRFTMAPIVAAVAALPLQMKRMTKPIITAVNGAAAGGGANLALAGDLIYMSDKAKLLQAFVNIGLAPDTGGAYLLPRIIGTTRAFEMFATGRPVGAEEAVSIGLVTAAFPADELMENVQSMAARLVQGPALSYAYIKKMMYASMFGGFEAYMPSEVFYQNSCAQSDDFEEGITAFMNKRKPRFQGK